MALKSDGTVWAWGAGVGSDTNVDYLQNIVPTNLNDVVQIAAGDVHSLALVGNGPPVIQVVLTQPILGTNGFSVSLPTQNGRVYQLEYKNSLTDSAWLSLPLHAGTGGMLQLTDPPLLPNGAIVSCDGDLSEITSVPAFGRKPDDWFFWKNAASAPPSFLTLVLFHYYRPTGTKRLRFVTDL